VRAGITIIDYGGCRDTGRGSSRQRSSPSSLPLTSWGLPTSLISSLVPLLPGELKPLRQMRCGG
jgi:hypothetical protein